MLWLDHWELIFPFTNTSWDTEKSYLKHIFNIAAVIIFLICYFKLNSVAFSYCCLFLNHLFTSIDSVLSCKCIQNHFSAVSLTFINLCTLAGAMPWPLRAQDHCSWCHTSLTALPLQTSEFATTILFSVFEASSALFLQRTLQYKWNMVCLSVV